ncbi:MAG: hypothetical protein BGO98_41920 [Myxococcales bacterium 68-20]|nr:hypothetical protein [Myxococcales bacterium]OJY27816.1 MAG: hypothetical protein BGO98_41920 [Myxococcales bacterium 68-20]
MSEMKPLLDESVSPDAAKLLRSAAKDGPESPKSAEARTLAAIGLLPAAELATSTLPTGRGFGSFTRLGMLGSLAVVAAFGVVLAVRTSSTAPALPPSAGPDAPKIAPAQPSASPPAPSVVETVRVEQLPSAAIDDGTGKVAVPRPSSASKAPSRPGLEDELAAIDGARSELASGHPDAALARVQSYQRTFRAGRFSEEADALEIQALAALGRLSEARAKGERFLAAHPGSPYERRVRSSIPSDEVKP